ncbi:MAG: lipoprotein-releasing ABC transporter ATP-binding protein LolD [Porticoccaceae bacterium]|nr:lipoprotein-releasing ABC transporter ATP-binding protein LolD [Pseudomonadales bacterium]MCP5171558.1 lipoprotein-releasing ABC transporter ATP-binding protein LolD [Pseudomonadales bacterium]
MNPDAVVLRDSVLECENLKMVYDQGSDQVHVLDNLQLNIVKGERVAIVGTSGSGKTTLLNLLGGLDDPTAGLVRVKGQDMALLNESQRATWRNQHLGFVYQFHHLLAEFSALENVAMPLLIGRYPANQARQIAAEILDRVSLSHRYQHKPAELSGGERQRVAIARALVTRPDCVLMDEPTGNLDPATAETVLQLLLELNRTLEISFVVVTHDHDIAARMDRVLLLENGTLKENNGLG